MPSARFAFIQGFCTAFALVLLIMLLVVPQYSDYRQRAEIAQTLAAARPLQNEIARRLKNRQALVPIMPHPNATTRISTDGWVLLITPRYRRQIVLMPSRQSNGDITWVQHFERGEVRQ